MNRTNFYTQLTVSDTKELDFLWNSLSKFEMQYPPKYYRIVGEDLLRPYNISFKCYGVPDFWWVICLVNSVENPLTDLIEGNVLVIPSQFDIYNFQRKYRVRRES